MTDFVAVAVIMGSVEVGCTKCRQTIVRGNFALCIIKEQYHYLIGDDNGTKICCGEERDIPCIFSSEKEAETARRILVAEIKEYGDTSHLSLFPLEGTISPTLH